MKGSNWKLGAKWLKCSECGKQTISGTRGRKRHYRGCKKSKEWHREALSGVDQHR